MKRLFSFLIAISLTFASLCSYSSAARQSQTGESNGRLLYLVESTEAKNSILESELAQAYAEMVDIVVADHEYSYSNSINYSAIAVPTALAAQLPLNTLFNTGTYICLYGNITITDFKNNLGLDRFGVERAIYDESDHICGSVFQEFVDTSVLYQVIGLKNSESKGLLCSIDSSPVMPYEYFNAIVSSVYPPAVMSTEIILSDFDLVEYYDNSMSSTHMDCILYRDVNETDAFTDYYAVKTNVWAETSPGVIREVDVQHALVGENDNIVSHQPGAQNGTSFNVSLSLGTGAVSISSTFSNRVSIDVSADYTNDTVTWSAYRATPYIGSGGISNEVITTGTSWAVPINSDILIDLSYRSSRGIGNAPPVIQDWETYRFGLYFL